MKLAYVFRTAPHGTADSREGLDALLAATAFCHEEDIAVYFMDDGVFNLISDQKPECILQKDFVRAFKLLDLYGIENRFVCSRSLEQFGLTQCNLVINCEKTDRTFMMRQLNRADKILVF